MKYLLIISITSFSCELLIVARRSQGSVNVYIQLVTILPSCLSIERFRVYIRKLSEIKQITLRSSPPSPPPTWRCCDCCNKKAGSSFHKEIRTKVQCLLCIGIAAHSGAGGSYLYRHSKIYVPLSPSLASSSFPPLVPENISHAKSLWNAHTHISL